MHVTPLPIAGLQRLHDGMSGFCEMFVSVTAGRGIATADVTADQTLTQLHPAQPRVGASLADVAAGSRLRIRLFQVLTFRH